MDSYVIDSGVLKENIRICRRLMGSRPIYAVVKGDGYGLGLAEYSRFLRAEGLERFAVTETAAVRCLRREGFAGEILLLRVVTEAREAEELAALGVVFSVGSRRSYELLEQTAARRQRAVRAHVYLDCGMGREGFAPEERRELLALCRRREWVRTEGVYTHFPCAGGRAGDTRQRFRAFMKAVAGMKQAGWQGLVHCAGSSAALRFEEMRLDAVRLGSALLGRVDWPGARALGLRPVGYIDARIAAICEVRPGQTLGYGAAFKARRPTRVAVLEVGYFHGCDTERCRDLFCLKDYIRAMLSPVKTLLGLRKRTALVHGQEVAVLGKVAMQNILLDVTDCPCEAEDRAILPLSPLLVRHLPRLFL